MLSFLLSKIRVDDDSPIHPRALPPTTTTHRRFPSQILTIAAGGITTREQAAELSDEGYDAVVLGRSLVAGGGGANGGDSGPELIRGVSGRVGVPRSMLGWGIKAEELHMKDSR